MYSLANQLEIIDVISNIIQYENMINRQHHSKNGDGTGARPLSTKLNDSGIDDEINVDQFDEADDT